MILRAASEEDIKAMTPEEYEAYAVQIINGIAGSVVGLLDALADTTIVPRVSILAALIEVAALVIDDNEPQRSEDISNFVTHFVSRVTGQEPKQ